MIDLRQSQSIDRSINWCSAARMAYSHIGFITLVYVAVKSYAVLFSLPLSLCSEVLLVCCFACVYLRAPGEGGAGGF